MTNAADENPSGDKPANDAVTVRWVVPDTMPAEFVTHFYVYDLGPAQKAWQLTLHRLEVPTRSSSEHSPQEVQATCVARTVMSDDTLKAMMLFLGRMAGKRLGITVTEHGTEDDEQASEGAV